MNRIAQDRITRRTGVQDLGQAPPGPPPREIDYVYLCEGCNHSWKESEPG